MLEVPFEVPPTEAAAPAPFVTGPLTTGLLTFPTAPPDPTPLSPAPRAYAAILLACAAAAIWPALVGRRLPYCMGASRFGGLHTSGSSESIFMTEGYAGAVDDGR